MKTRHTEAHETVIDNVLRSLPLIEDDLYLGMQASNLFIVNSILLDMEEGLLAEYMDAERTPVPEALTVSAFSQLWVLGLYELLRTWRARAQTVIDFAEQISSLPADQRAAEIERKKKQVEAGSERGFGLVFRWPALERAAHDAGYVEEIQNAVDRSEILFRRLAALRMSLAKHEIPQSRGFATAPGYGRINATNGSIYWQVELGNNEVDIVSRRDLADMCRGMNRDISAFILPKCLQNKVATFPKFSYALRQVKVSLRDGTRYERVWVYWAKRVVRVLGRTDIPFDAREIVDIEHDPSSPPVPKREPRKVK